VSWQTSSWLSRSGAANSTYIVLQPGRHENPARKQLGLGGRTYRFSGLVQSSLCPEVHRLESTVRYLGIEVDDALEISEQTEI